MTAGESKSFFLSTLDNTVFHSGLKVHIHSSMYELDQHTYYDLASFLAPL